MYSFIPLSVPNLKGNEHKYVNEALESEWVSSGGPHINKFEDAVSNYISAAYAAACQSGTAGLHLSLTACGVGNGDEVIVPTLTFIAAVNPVRYVGAEPVFMDCDDSLCMDTKKLASFLDTQCELKGQTLFNKKTKRPIKAIIVVHVFGNMADMETLVQLASHYHLVVIEDATEALGTCYNSGSLKGRYAGTIGDVGVLSFNGNKIITTGGGGMVVSNNQTIVDKVRFLSTQAKTDSLYFVHDEIGYNYRMTNVQAALGLGQMEQLDNFISTKKRNYMLYQSLGIALLPFRADIDPNYWFYSHITDRVDTFLTSLDQYQIQARPVWRLIHTQKPYLGCQSWQIEKALFYEKNIINLPCSTNLTEEDVTRVAAAIKEIASMS